MSMRLHEAHPTLVHYPLALFPAALICDTIGWLTGSRALLRAGATLMPLATASAGVAGAAGLAAQEAVEARGHAHDMLSTHRTLNLTLVALTTAMSLVRARRDEPPAGYLLAGWAGLMAMSYSAYLGGKMVYDHGVGVRAAGGVRDARSPELHLGNVGQVGRTAGRNIRDGVRHGVEEMRQEGMRPLRAGMRSS